MNYGLDIAYLGRFLGLAQYAAENRGRRTDEKLVNDLILLREEYIRRNSFPGALITTEGQAVRGHQEGHEAGK